MDKISKDLINAVLASDADLCRSLLAQGADPNAIASNGLSALALAVSRRSAKIVEELVKYGADLTIRSSTPDGRLNQTPILVLSAANGELGTLEVLLVAGCDPNIADATGLTPLMSASFQGHDKIVQRLIEYNANMHVVDVYGQNALMFAANASREAIVKLLLENGSNPNVIAKDGSTALMFAAQRGSLAIVSLLIQYRADTTIRGIHKYRAIDFARQNGHRSVIALLEKKRSPAASDAY